MTWELLLLFNCMNSIRKMKFADSWYREDTVNQIRKRDCKKTGNLGLPDESKERSDISSFEYLWFQIACLVPVDQFQLYQRLKFERGMYMLFFSS